MSNETKHTPPPWLVDPESGEVINQYHVQNSDGRWGLQTRGLAKVYSPANAAFIIRACNAHEHLLAALKLCHQAICDAHAPMGAHEIQEHWQDQQLDKARKRAAAAIAKAESA